jgi:DMSO reductase family type II enzyme chaperone
MSANSTEQTTLQSDKETEIDLYRLFAFALGEPTPERYAWLHRTELAAGLEGIWKSLGCEGAFPGINRYESYGDYEAAYISVFDVGAPQPPVPLLESAHYKALPAQQTALENTYFHEVLGLKADTSRYAPDHLVTQLEFLAAVRYAREHAPEQTNRQDLARLERDFLQRHMLNWLPAAGRKLERQHQPIFSALFSLLVAVVHQNTRCLSEMLAQR